MTRLLQWLVDDERLKPREQRSAHPIPQDPPYSDSESLVQYCFTLQCHVARLHDQVWWLSLPRWRRAAYRLLGFRAPIQQFYLGPECQR